jgi:hypothetical protein
MRLTKADKERFRSKVSKRADGCWIWTSDKAKFGHGRFCVTVNGKSLVYFAHRIAYYEHHNLPIPRGRCGALGPIIAHRCDVPQCVNPDHLFLTDQKGNIRDAIAKGRTDYSAKAARTNFVRWGFKTPAYANQ